jgi:hypothetical protein
MSEKRPTSYYITSREGAIWAEFAEHGRDVAARRVLPHTLPNKASVSYLTELTDERRDKMDDRVTHALFNGGVWATRDPVAGGNEVIRMRSVNLADLKITPTQFKDSVMRIFAVMGVTPAQIGVRFVWTHADGCKNTRQCLPQESSSDHRIPRTCCSAPRRRSVTCEA